MVAVVAGGSLGLVLGSAATLGGLGSNGQASLGRSGQGIYVNAATGNLVIQAQDELLLGRGPDAPSLRTYNSLGQMTDDNGDNWNPGWSRTVWLSSGTVGQVGSTATRRSDDGSEAVFSWDASKGLYLSTDGAGAHDTLSYVAANGKWTYVEGSSRIVEVYVASRQDGFVFVPSSKGFLLSQTDASGNSLTFLNAKTGGVRSVTTSSGEVTYFDYTGTQLTQVRTVTKSSSGSGLDTTLTRVRYAYDASNRLQSVTVDLSPENNAVSDGNVFTTTYTYDGTSKRVTSITQSDGVTLAFTYELVGSTYRVKTVQDAKSGLLTFTYDTVNRRTTVRDPLGQDTVYTYDSLGQLREVRSTLDTGAVLTSSYNYTARGDVESITDGEGRAVQMTYDDWGNLLRQNDAAGNVVRRTYNGNNQMLAETVATLGEPPNTTPAARNVYDAGGKSLLRFQISPEGRVTEHRYDAPGQRTATIRYALGQYPVSALTIVSTLTETDLVNWVVTQDRTRTERVDYQYDWRGQLSQSTSYANVDASGNGLLDGGHAVTRYVYDPAGQLLHTYSPKNEATHFTYDGLGRLLTSTNALSQTSVNVYDDANRRVQTTAANGLLSTSLYDTLGRLVSVQQTGNRSGLNFGLSQNYYDAKSQLRMTRDATGSLQWYFYDPAGRKVGTVNALGQLQEYVYDRSGKLTQTIDYATPVNTATLVDASGNPTLLGLASVRPTAGSAYRASWNAYDAVGRLAKTVSPLGEVTEFGYDNAGRVISTRRYANVISTASLGGTPAASAINPIPNGADRLQRNFYGYDGQLLATLDGAGGLVEYRYDAAGRATTRISHVTPAPAAQQASGTLAQVTPADSTGDSKTLSFYNARGQVVAELDALKFLIEKVYDENGNLSKVLRYPTQPVSVAVDPTTSLATLKTNAGAVLEQTSYSYDAINRQLTQRVDPNGLNIATTYTYDDTQNRLTVTAPTGVKTETQFDELGRALTVTVDSAPGGLALQTQNTYDNLGRLKSSTDAKGVRTEYGYDALGRRHTATVDAGSGGLNLLTTYDYDRQGNLARVIDANGQHTRYVYDSDNRLRYTLDAEYGLTENRYDALGNLNQTVRYVYRQTDVQTTDIGGGLIANTITPNASLFSDSATRYVYDTEGRLQYQQNALGGVIENRYDARGQLSTRIEWVPTISPVTALTASDFATALGALNTARDRVTRFVYDAAGQRIFAQDALGTVTQTRYDAAGRVAEQIARANRIPTNTALTKEAFEGAIQPDPIRDRTSRCVYDAAGRCVYEQDARGAVTEYRYDKLGRVAESVAYATAISITTALQPAAFAAALTNPGGVADAAKDRLTRHVYDAAGRLVFDQDALGTVVQYRYDARGQVAERVEWAARIATTTPLTPTDFANALQPKADPARDRLTRYVYDAAGRLAFQQDALGGVTQFRYDALGQTLERIVRATRLATNLALTTGAFQAAVNANVNVALDRSSRYVYDKAGHVRFSIDALGGTVENIYDSLGQLARAIAYDTALVYSSVTDAATPQSVRAQLPTSTLGARETLYAYDLIGQLKYTARSTTANATQKFFAVAENTYNSLGQLSQSRAYATTVVLSGLADILAPGDITPRLTSLNTQDRKTDYSYFVDGRLKQTQDGEGYTESFTYDALGNKKTYKNKNDSVTDYDYDVAGHLIEEKSAAVDVASVNGSMLVSVANLRITTRMSYDAFGGLSSRTEAFGVDGQERVTQYEYDKLGRQLRTLYGTVKVYDASGDNLASNGINGGAVTRAEIDLALVSETAYNSFGEAVIGRDVSGFFSYKSYDRLGRVVNEVDGNHYVTRHGYSAADGEYADLTRLQTAAGITTDGWTVTEATVDAAVDAALTGGSRNIRTYTDRLGRMSSVQDLAGVYSFDSTSATDGTWTRVNSYAYTVWGDVASTSVTLNGSGGAAVTRNRYDLGGRLARVIDAEGYVTDYKKNAFGETERFTEYVTKLTGTDYDAAVASVLPSTVTDAATYDRTTQVYFDRVGRVTDEDHLYAQFAKRTAANSAQRTWGTLRTSKQYDGAGNVTVVTQSSQELGTGSFTVIGRSYQGYDAMGRLVRSQQSVDGSDSARRTTLVEYDALGNATRSTRYANLAAGTATPQTDSAKDQKTLTLYDKLGRVLQTRDSENNDSFFSYDAAGRVAKQWVPYTDALGTALNSIQLFDYDKAGNQTQTRTFAQSAETTAGTYRTGAGYFTETAVYNAFGEISSKLRDGVQYAYYDYDAGGRVWRTNAEDGVDKVFLYDLQGNVSMVVTSIALTGTGVQAYQSASAVPHTGVTLRTATKYYDKLGHLIQQRASAVTHLNSSTTSIQDQQTVDRWGNVLSATTTLGSVTNYRYDQNNHVIEEKLPAVDYYSDYIHVRNADGTIQTDTAGTLQQLARPTTQIFYDAAGRNIGKTDARSKTSTATYKFTGELDREDNADGGWITHGYDNFGREVWRASATYNTGAENGTIHNYVWNRLGQLTSESIVGRLLTHTDATSIVESTFVYSSGVEHNVGSYSYDALGRRKTSTSGDDDAKAGVVTRYSFDTAGRMAWSQNADTLRVVRYGYNAAGQKTSEKDALGKEATWVYGGTGRLLNHTDIGTALTEYDYDLAGQLTRQHNNRGQDLRYTYYEDGRAKTIQDLWLNSTSTFDYDAEGHKSTDRFVSASRTYRDVTMTYDALGRIKTVADTATGTGLMPSYSLTIQYDANGNRYGVSGTTGDVDVWEQWTELDPTHISLPDDDGLSSRAVNMTYTYDAMNRLTGTMFGRYSEPPSGTPTLTSLWEYYRYNKDGARVSEEHRIAEGGAAGTISSRLVEYQYDFAGRVAETFATVKTRAANGTDVNGTRRAHRKVIYAPTATEGWSQEWVWAKTFAVDSFSYNDEAPDRVLTTKSTVNGEGVTTNIEGKNRRTNSSTWYTTLAQTSLFDLAGNLKSTQVTTYADQSTTVAGSDAYAYTYLKMEGYLKYQASVTNAQGTATTTHDYDVNGRLIEVNDNNPAAYNLDQYLVTDHAGHVVMQVRRRTWAVLPSYAVTGIYNPATNTHATLSGSVPAAPQLPAAVDLAAAWPINGSHNPSSLQFLRFANDQQIGISGQYNSIKRVRRTPDDGGSLYWEMTYSQKVNSQFEDGLGADTVKTSSNGGLQYTWRQDDTLRSLAQTFYGDANLWYVIAEANGFAGEDGAAPAPGTVISIPTVTRSSNTASTFMVYDASRVIGNTDPTPIAPPPPPAADGGCGGIGTIIVVAVAVAVTVWTAGAAAAAMSTTATAAAGSTLGASVLAGTATGISPGLMAVAAAVGGAAGSVAGQAVAIAAGMQDSVNWRQVGIGAIGAGVSSGLGAAGLSGSSPAIRAAATSIATQRLSVAVGLQAQFSWRSVAASMVAAPAANLAGDLAGSVASGLSVSNSIAMSTVQGIVRGVVGQRVRMSITRQGKIDYGSIAADAFGNALGDSIVAQSQVRTLDSGRLPAAPAQVAPLETLGTVEMPELGQVPRLRVPEGWDDSGYDDSAARVRGPNADARDAAEQNAAIRARAAAQVAAQARAANASRASGMFWGEGLSLDGAGASFSASSMRSANGTGLASSNSPGFYGYAGGAAELLLGGVYNGIVRIGSGFASVPFLLDGVDAAVAVQEGTRESLSYRFRSDGAQAIAGDLAPVFGYLQNNVIDPTRNFSERHLGDGLTTVLGVGVQSGIEIYGTVTGLRAAGSFGTAALDSAFSAPISGSRAAQLGGVDFGALLRKADGPPPEGMVDPHAHHILFKEGNGATQKALVAEGQAILRSYDIDPIMGTENLVWAPNRVTGQHHADSLRNVVTELRQTHEFVGTRDAIIKKLDQLGQLAARRK